MTGEGDALASVPLYGEFSASHLWGQNSCGSCSGLCSIFRRGLSQPLSWRAPQGGRCSGLCSLGRRGLSQPLLWRKRQIIAVLWPLFACSAWAQPATVEAGTTDEGAALDCSFVRRGLSHLLWWRA
jgi:hypothetical protein